MFDRLIALFSSDRSRTERRSSVAADTLPQQELVEVPPEANMRFSDEDVKDKLRVMNDQQLDALPFGVIKVDDSGRILFYNKYESELAGVAKEEAMGRNFFTQVAPCSNSRLFYGHFKDGMVQGQLDKRFVYTFTYKMRPTLVRAQLYRDPANNNWVLIEKC